MNVKFHDISLTNIDGNLWASFVRDISRNSSFLPSRAQSQNLLKIFYFQEEIYALSSYPADLLTCKVTLLLWYQNYILTISIATNFALYIEKWMCCVLLDVTVVIAVVLVVRVVTVAIVIMHGR